MRAYNELYDNRTVSRRDGRIGTVVTWLALAGLVFCAVAYVAGKL